MVYIDRYIPIYMFKYVYVHIQVRQQLEYKLKSKKRETRPFSLDWYYQPRLKGWAQVLACPPTQSLFVIPTGTKGSVGTTGTKGGLLSPNFSPG
jgi:hypothetical protein